MADTMGVFQNASYSRCHALRLRSFHGKCECAVCVCVSLDIQPSNVIVTRSCFSFPNVLETLPDRFRRLWACIIRCVVLCSSLRTKFRPRSYRWFRHMKVQCDLGSGCTRKPTVVSATVDGQVPRASYVCKDSNKESE